MDDAISIIPGTSEIHAHTFANALGGKVTTHPSGALAFYVGIGPHLKEQVLAASEQGVKTVAYWIGTDSLYALSDQGYRGGIPRFDLHLCVHERIRSELARWGVSSKVVWPCPRKVPKEQVITRKCVGSYQPTPHDGDIYYFNETCEIARQNPEIPFLFYGAQEYPVLPENVKDAGRLAPEVAQDILNQCSCVLRMTRHDGHPVGGIEAKMRGLHVIENFPYPGFIYADHSDAVTCFLNEKTTHEVDTSEWPEFYRQECSPQAFERKIWNKIEGLL